MQLLISNSIPRLAWVQYRARDISIAFLVSEYSDLEPSWQIQLKLNCIPGGHPRLTILLQHQSTPHAATDFSHQHHNP